MKAPRQQLEEHNPTKVERRVSIAEETMQNCFSTVAIPCDESSRHRTSNLKG